VLVRLEPGPARCGLPARWSPSTPDLAGDPYRRMACSVLPTFREAVVMAKAIRLLIKNGTLIDGSGGDPVPNRLLVVEGNRITLVRETDSSMRPETPDDTVIDATGKFILPGLIDAHCHISLHQGALPSVKYTSTAEFCTLWAAHAIGRVLRAGVTSIAVPGGKWFTAVFGESGGGGKVSVLLAMPAAKGLFHRAIIQSGAAIRVSTRERASALAAQALRELGLRGQECERLLEQPPERILAAIAPAVRAVGRSRWLIKSTPRLHCLRVSRNELVARIA
jgi:cytosine/adenosine deaminase-related metal-dependent hydrolase